MQIDIHCKNCDHVVGTTEMPSAPIAPLKGSTLCDTCFNAITPAHEPLPPAPPSDGE